MMIKSVPNYQADNDSQVEEDGDEITKTHLCYIKPYKQTTRKFQSTQK